MRYAVPSAAFIGGSGVAAFEEEFASFTGARHCVAAANGTDAIELAALRAFGIGRGDEVIAPANRFIATAEVVARVGADIVLTDCDTHHLLLDPASTVERLTPRTRAVVAATSFYPGKNLRADGDAGGVITGESATAAWH